jgi:hypothetical protein
MVGPILSLVLLTGACRGIVGIEDLGLDAGSDAAAPGTDGSTDGGTTKDATTDATSDAPPPPDGGPPNPLGECDAGDYCQPCCKNSHHSFPSFEMAQQTKSCMCTASVCPECVGTDYCNGSGPPPGPPSNCAPCLDSKYASGQCTQACTDSDCQAALACIKACPPR